MAQIGRLRRHHAGWAGWTGDAREPRHRRRRASGRRAGGAFGLCDAAAAHPCELGPISPAPALHARDFHLGRADPCRGRTRRRCHGRVSRPRRNAAQPHHRRSGPPHGACGRRPWYDGPHRLARSPARGRLAMSRLLTLYQAGTTALGPVVALYLARRMAHGKEDRERFSERQGCAGRPRPPGPLVWVHAASNGEAVSMLSLIDRLLVERPALSVLVTTGTVTSARLLAHRLPADRAWHQYVPVDRPAYVKRFLEHWRPDLALWVESELWPNLVSQADRAGIPLLLLNGRMSARSFRGWQRVPGLIAPLLACFELCLAQDEVQAERFRRLGAAAAATVGDLKTAAAPLPFDESELDRIAASAVGRPLWLAASTHQGEEEAAALVHRALAPAR